MIKRFKTNLVVWCIRAANVFFIQGFYHRQIVKIGNLQPVECQSPHSLLEMNVRHITNKYSRVNKNATIKGFIIERKGDFVANFR